MDQKTQQNTQKKQERQEESFSVSVMPKDFRGKEGLKKAYVSQPTRTPQPQQQAKPKPQPKPTPPKQPPIPKPKQVSPEKAAKSTLQQPIKQPRHVSVVLILGGILVIAIISSFAIWAIFFATPQTSQVPTTKPPIQVTQQQNKDQQQESQETTQNTQQTTEQLADKPQQDVFEQELLPGKDTDSDGLTDVEEVMYGTKYNIPDTDKDGFLDGNEVFHLFHPNGVAPLTLKDTGAVEEIAPSSMSYTILTPQRWAKQTLEAQFLFSMTSQTGETFQILEQITEPETTLEQFYAELSKQTQTGEEETQQRDMQPFKTKQGYEGLWTSDRLTAYVRLSDTKILIFSYQTGKATRIVYRQTFEMMINSIKQVEYDEI